MASEAIDLKKNTENIPENIAGNNSEKTTGNATENKESLPPCCRHTNRSEETKKALLTRLKKAEGQIRGIEKMVENDLYCPDILIQVSAVTSALNSFNKVLLQEHIKGCVTRDIKAGKDESVDELCKVLQKLMK